MTGNKEHQENLLQFMRAVMKQDDELRQQYHTGEKFRFIRDRLHALLITIEESLVTLDQADERKIQQVHEDEQLVYVYLYNAHGVTAHAWHKMLRSSVFYEYSVNRPLYLEKSQVESYIRSKANYAQHGYLTIVVKKNDVLQGVEAAKDSLGQPLFKVREGSLHFERLINFTYNGHDYFINKIGELVKR